MLMWPWLMLCIKATASSGVGFLQRFSELGTFGIGGVRGDLDGDACRAPGIAFGRNDCCRVAFGGHLCGSGREPQESKHHKGDE